MLQVVHAISDENIGGAGVLLTHLLQHLDRTLFSSTVLLPAGSALETRLARMDVPTVSLSMRGVRGISETWGALRALRPAILHTHAALSARLAGRGYGVPICLYTRHCAAASPRLRTPPLPQLQPNMFPLLADCVVATGASARQALLAEGVPEGRIRLIPNGAPPSRRTSEEARDALRVALGIGAGNFVVGMVARMEEVKGPDILLAAASLLLRRYPGYRFLLVGSGSLLPALRKRADALGIADAVRFCGFAEQPDALRNLFDLTVCPSRDSETTPLAISEGFSLGLPAVVSLAGSAAAMLHPPHTPPPLYDAPSLPHGAAGLAVPVGNAAALAAAIERLRCSPSLYATLSQNARARYTALYTAERMGAAYTRLYCELLAEKGIFLHCDR